jgi:membrane protein
LPWQATLPNLPSPADERPRAIRSWLSALRDALLALPGATVLVTAARNYVMHQSANQAGSVAFSWLLAMFPLVLLLSSAAGFFGRPGDAAELVLRAVSYAPPLVGDVLRPSIKQVLGHRNQALLALGVFATVWTASSGMQAVRTALNRAYGVERGLPFWKARIKVTLLTIVVGVGMVVAFGSVVVMPHLLAALDRSAPDHQTLLWLRGGLRYGAAFVFLTVLYGVLYAWLPDVRRDPRRPIVAGAATGALLWVAAVLLLTVTLRSAGKLALIYGSLAGSVATLVFLYASAATLIFGAELNGALRARADHRQTRAAAPTESVSLR